MNDIQGEKKVRKEKRERKGVTSRGGRETRAGTKKGMSGKIKISERIPGGEVKKCRKETEGA